MTLEKYRAKRNFAKTPEPPARAAKPHAAPIFVVQEHHATRLHYDFRLEVDGVLKSWAVPKEPSLDPKVKRLAVRVEDHPLGYASFAGTIPEGLYGAGKVHIWDTGTYEPDNDDSAGMEQSLEAGRVAFSLHGKKLRGKFALVRMRGRGAKENWLLIKTKDRFARSAPEEARPQTQSPRKSSSKAAPVRPARSKHPHGPVEFTHTDKLLYPESGITKGDVLDYYRSVAEVLLPYLRERPCTLERLPEGVGAGKPHFWQKDTPAYYPEWIPRAPLTAENGKVVHYVLVNDVDTLLYLVNQGTLTFHVWFSRVESLDRPDFVLFDLDRGEASFADAVAVARELRELLAERDVPTFLKTSGKSGLHVLTPWQEAGGYDESRRWAQQVAAHVVEALPEQATMEIRKAKRHGRVYVDTVENAWGHHAVPPYVLRAVPGAPVSTPLAWRELKPTTDPGAYNLNTVPARLRRQKIEPMAALLGGTSRARAVEDRKR